MISGEIKTDRFENYNLERKIAVREVIMHSRDFHRSLRDYFG